MTAVRKKLNPKVNYEEVAEELFQDLINEDAEVKKNLNKTLQEARKQHDYSNRSLAGYFLGGESQIPLLPDDEGMKMVNELLKEKDKEKWHEKSLNAQVLTFLIKAKYEITVSFRHINPIQSFIRRNFEALEKEKENQVLREQVSVIGPSEDLTASFINTVQLAKRQHEAVKKQKKQRDEEFSNMMKQRADNPPPRPAFPSSFGTVLPSSAQVQTNKSPDDAEKPAVLPPPPPPLSALFTKPVKNEVKPNPVIVIGAIDYRKEREAEMATIQKAMPFQNAKNTADLLTADLNRFWQKKRAAADAGKQNTLNSKQVNRVKEIRLPDITLELP